MRPIETVHSESREAVDSPAYRVNFWERALPERGWNLDAFALTEVENVTEVLRWVDEHARGRRFEIFVEMEEEPEASFHTPRTTGLIRLAGSNPNANQAFEVRASHQRSFFSPDRRPQAVRRIQAVVATMGFSGFDSSRCMAWAGVIPPSVLRGRLLSSVATSSSRSGEWIERSVPFGKYWRSNGLVPDPFVFSLVPRCQGECGSQK